MNHLRIELHDGYHWKPSNLSYIYMSQNSIYQKFRKAPNKEQQGYESIEQTPFGRILPE